MSMRNEIALFLGRISVLAVLVASAAPAAAEVLVLLDGTRLETDGSWDVRGSLVVFTSPEGVLSSIRTVDADFEASRAAQRETDVAVALAQEPTGAVRRPSILVLTDEDIPGPMATAADASGSTPSAATRPRSRLVVETWATIEISESSGLEVVGLLRNRGQARQLIDNVRVELRGSGGEVIQSALAMPTDRVLPASASTRFRAELYNVRKYDKITFKIASNSRF